MGYSLRDRDRKDDREREREEGVWCGSEGHGGGEVLVLRDREGIVQFNPLIITHVGLDSSTRQVATIPFCSPSRAR